MESQTINITLEQLKIMKHAYGGGKRDHYCTHLTDPDMVDLVAKGYFFGPRGVGHVGDNCGMFYLTESGIKLLKEISK